MLDNLIGTILNYGSGIWSFHCAKNIELVHNIFCWFVLKIGLYSLICDVIDENGYLPVYVLRKQRIIQYWFIIVTMKSPHVFYVYRMLVDCVVIRFWLHSFWCNQ